MNIKQFVNAKIAELRKAEAKQEELDPWDHAAFAGIHGEWNVVYELAREFGVKIEEQGTC